MPCWRTGQLQAPRNSYYMILQKVVGVCISFSFIFSPMLQQKIHERAQMKKKKKKEQAQTQSWVF